MAVVEAVRDCDLKKLKQLIETGHSANETDSNGDTALHLAAENWCFYDVLNFLLQQPDIHINKRNLDGETALHLAVIHCQPDVASLLIQKGTDINAVCESTSFTPLHYAVHESNYAMVAMLLYYGADTDVVTKDGETPFMMTLRKGNVQIQKLLLEYEVDFNRALNNRVSTLQIALKYNSPLVPVLIKKGADINLTDKEVLLHYAVRHCNLDLASLLIENGANINAVYKRSSYTPLHYAVYDSTYEMVAMLLYYGADCDVVTAEGCTPFMLALRREDSQIQELLLEYEVDLNRTDKKGVTILQMALQSHNSSLISDLIERGTDVKYTPQYNCSDVLYNALQRRDNSFFKTVWGLCDYHVIYDDIEYRPTLIEAFKETRLPTKDWLECLTMVFHSDVIHDVILDHRLAYEVSDSRSRYMIQQFCGLLIQMFAERQLSEDELFPFICISLSEGANVYYTDVAEMYDYYGYNKTLKLFLEFDIEMNQKLFCYMYPMLPLFICDVAKDPKTELNKLWIERNYGCVKYINDLLDMFTPPPGFVNRFEGYLRKYPQFEEEFQSVRERLKLFYVASLKELSRDVLKRAMCDKLGITNCYDFYVAVKKLPIPPSLKKIMAYQVPLNKLVTVTNNVV